MEPTSIIVIITAVLPFITAAAKKVLKTDKLSEQTSKGVNAIIPIVLGVLSAGLYSYVEDRNWVKALAIGLSSGGVASSARDIEKNLLGIVSSILKIVKKDKPAA